MKPDRRLRLAFVSTVFLLPADAGGKIRTGNVLRGLKGGAFDITLLCPAAPMDGPDWQADLSRMADRVVTWPAPAARPRWTRVVDLMDTRPANVCHGIGDVARQAVQRVLAEGAFDLVVFDFVHATELMPAGLSVPSLCFTHNVEAEIFARHAQQAGNPAMRWLWASQARKMRDYERHALARYSAVIAVSDRDARLFAQQAGRVDVQTIPTAVDLDFFAWQRSPALLPDQAPTVVFTGSMDWAANVDGVGWFLDKIWPQIIQRLPGARFVVVGRHPPPSLVRQAQMHAGVSFTGFVDDVRPHVRGAHVFVIPLRVGGGTRIKAFEAMAMGCPVVSTTLGVEGLDVVDGEHLLQCDEAAAFARSVIDLMGNEALRLSLSVNARALVEQRFGHMAAARVFEDICLGVTSPVVQTAEARRPAPELVAPA